MTLKLVSQTNVDFWFRFIKISDKDSGGYWELLSGISILSLQ